MNIEKTYYIIALCLSYAILNVSGTALIKNAVVGSDLNSIRSYIYTLFELKVMTGILLNFSSMLIMMKALSLEKFTYVFPVAIGINFAITVIIGYIVFGEEVDINLLFGLLFIMAGIILMS